MEGGFDDEDGVELEDLLLDSAENPLNNFSAKLEEWLEANGQRYHKGSLVAQYLETNRSKKVIERTLCVRDLTMDDLRKHHPAPPVSENNPHVSDLAGTLSVCIGKTIYFVVFQATAVRKDQSIKHIINTDR